MLTMLVTNHPLLAESESQNMSPYPIWKLDRYVTLLYYVSLVRSVTVTQVSARHLAKFSLWN